MRERPAAPAQSTLYTLAESAVEVSHRLAQLSVSLGGPVPIKLLRETWSRLASAHGALRSSFRKSHAKPLIRIDHDGAEAPWRELDWQEIPGAEIPSRWAAILAEEASRPIDPSSPPPIRFVAITLPGGATHLLATYPRFVFDEEAWFFILCEWLEAIGGRAPAPAPDASPATPLAAADASWWRNHLAEALPHTFEFFGSPAPANENQVLLDRETTADIAAACKRLDLSTREALLGALAFLISRLTLRERSLLLAAAECDQPDPGSRLNFLPVEIPVDESKTLADLLRATAAIERARARAAGLPLEEIPFPQGLSPIISNFAAAYSWLPPSLNDRISDVDPRWINLDSRILDHPIHPLELQARDGARLSIRLRAANLPPAEVSRLLEALEAFLLALISNPQVPLRDLEMPGCPSAPARDGEPSMQPAPIHEIIEDAANAHPDTHAIEDADGAPLSFREVQDYGNLLAAHLHSRNLGEGWTIAVCLAPSPWVPVALLGVLRAGDTCVPLDPSASAQWLIAKVVATDTELVICDSVTRTAFEEAGKKVLVIDQEWEQIAATQPTDHRPAKPKIALILTGTEHRDPPPLFQIPPALLSTACKRTLQAADIRPGDRVAITAPAGTASYASTILATLAAGGTAVFTHGCSPSDFQTAAATHACLTADEFAALVAALRSGACLPADFHALAVDARGHNVSAPAQAAWQEATEGKSRWFAFLSPCDFPGFGLQFPPQDGSENEDPATALPTIPVGRPVRGSGFLFENLVGKQPPFGYPGRGSFLPPGSTNACAHFRAWRDAAGLIHQIAPDPRSEAILETLRAVPGVLNAAWDPSRPDSVWFEAPASVTPESLAAALADALPPQLRPTKLHRVQAIPLLHGYTHLAALEVPAEPKPHAIVPRPRQAIAKYTDSTAKPASQHLPQATPASASTPSAATSTVRPSSETPGRPPEEAPPAQPDPMESTPGTPEPSASPAPEPHPARRHLLPLGGHPESPHLVLVGPLGASPTSLESLASCLAADWSVSTIDLAPSGQNPDAAANRVFSVLSKESPSGPLHMLGVCTGAVVAFEAARLLRASGREVPYLALAGSSPPAAPEHEKSGWLDVLKRGFGGGGQRPKVLQGPCGILLTPDLSDDAEPGWLEAAPDAILEQITPASASLLAAGAPALAATVKRLAGLPSDSA